MFPILSKFTLAPDIVATDVPFGAVPKLTCLRKPANAKAPAGSTKVRVTS